MCKIQASVSLMLRDDVVAAIDAVLQDETPTPEQRMVEADGQLRITPPPHAMRDRFGDRPVAWCHEV